MSKKKNLDTLMQEAIVRVEEQPYEIPENWFWTDLKAISTYIQRGKSPKYVEQSDVKVVSQKCVQWSGFDISLARCIDEGSLKSYKEERYLRKTDILWNSTGTGTIGRLALIEDDLEGINVADSHVTVVRPNNSIVNSKLLFRWLSSPYVQNKLNNLWSGSTNQVELNLTTVKNQLVPIPPYKEQKRIIEKVERILNKIEEAKRLIEEAKETFELRRAAILDKAFRGHLIEDKESWEELKLGDLISEGPQNGLYKPQTAYGDGSLIVRIDNFYSGYINEWNTLRRLELNENELEIYGLDEGDLLINRVNSIQYLGKSALVRNLREDCVFESNVMRLKINNELVDNEYLILYLNSDRGLKELRKNAKHAVNQASINQSDVKNVIVPIPNLAQQELIVKKALELLEKDKMALQLIQQQRNVLEELKQSILSKAFKGELGTYDSNDDSAIELLKSILQEKL
ncbi:restriction endonuclease subunit S [Bacillus wiedmannii]|uniref:restriction endonuclease subunit S n=1 Tax=Bacillus wiedmannii TaxID=1890302 RepID=UPI002E232082|nr:restriction endonuclease subunit S [Bacillus wiedmannii]